MTTTREVYDQVKNALDFLAEADLTLYVNPVSVDATAVAWHPPNPSGSFLTSHGHPDINQYERWAVSGHYSAMLFDGSLLQIRYQLDDGELVSHRLNYFPSPFDFDLDMLAEGFPIEEVIELHRDADAALRSPIRFDFDMGAASEHHAASHVTLNGTECRIPCLAPFHILRFLDFVFSHFYPGLRSAHESFFNAAESRHLGTPSLTESQKRRTHLSWDVHASATGGELGR